MIILAIDTAAGLCAACLYDGSAHRVLARKEEDIGRGHAERLLPIIEKVMQQADRRFDELDRLAVCVGPGSFTGVRVGVAAMRGLSLALDIPLIGVSVFDVMDRGADGGQPVLATIDARRDEVYAQLFAADGVTADLPQVMSPGAACALARRAGAAVVGSGVAAIRPHMSATADDPEILGESATVDLIRLAEVALVRDAGPERPVPLYLRAPDAKPQTGYALPRSKAVS